MLVADRLADHRRVRRQRARSGWRRAGRRPRRARSRPPRPRSGTSSGRRTRRGSRRRCPRPAPSGPSRRAGDRARSAGSSDSHPVALGHVERSRLRFLEIRSRRQRCHAARCDRGMIAPERLRSRRTGLISGRWTRIGRQPVTSGDGGRPARSPTRTGGSSGSTATPIDGPDPYGDPDPAWLGIDWRQHLRLDRRRRRPHQLRRDRRGSGDHLRPRARRLLAELAREHAADGRAGLSRDRPRPARLRRQPDAAVGDLDPRLRRACSTTSARRSASRPARSSATRWAASSRPRSRSASPSGSTGSCSSPRPGSATRRCDRGPVMAGARISVATNPLLLRARRRRR